ncbi:MAG: type VI secretion lipoprotein TssJ [Syntrophobacteraceae bacterium]
MKRYAGIFFVLVILVLGSCASPPPPPQPVMSIEPRPIYTEKFITLHLQADPQLNLYSGSSHALHLCVYQLTDPNAFIQLSENEMGIGKLLGCDRVDAGPIVQGAAMGRKFIVQPGEDQRFELDRAEGAKYVGVVAGYYNLQKRRTVRLYTIPTSEEREQGMVVIKQKPLRINLFLGPQALED